MLTPISRRVNHWVERGIITPAQALAIKEYENQGGRSWIAYGVVGTGVTAIATGIVSLIAANWESIPPTLKLVNYFALQIGAAIAFLRLEKKDSVWREAAIAIFALLFFAGIGLFSQIFNLTGEGWPACLFWCALSLPAIALSQRLYLPNAWTVFLGVTAMWWMSATSRHGGDENLRGMLLFSLPLALAAMSFWAQVARMLSYPFKKAFTFWGIGTYAVVGTILGNVLWHGANHFRPHTHLDYIIIPWLTLFVAVAGCLARPHTEKTLRLSTAAFLLAIGIFLTIPLYFPPDFRIDPLLGKSIGAAGFILIAAIGAYVAALAHEKRLFEIATQLIALRFIIIYFQVFGDLTKTGIGLILSGVVILGVTYFWNRIKKTLFAKMGGQS